MCCWLFSKFLLLKKLLVFLIGSTCHILVLCYLSFISLVLQKSFARNLVNSQLFRLNLVASIFATTMSMWDAIYLQMSFKSPLQGLLACFERMKARLGILFHFVCTPHVDYRHFDQTLEINEEEVLRNFCKRVRSHFRQFYFALRFWLFIKTCFVNYCYGSRSECRLMTTVQRRKGTSNGVPKHGAEQRKEPQHEPSKCVKTRQRQRVRRVAGGHAAAKKRLHQLPLLTRQQRKW